MDVGKSFTFAFEDQDWLKKLGLGVLIALVPILNFAWTGYMVEIIRRVSEGRALPLPDWDDLGKKFVDGLIIAFAGFVYMLPGMLLFILPLALVIIPLLVGNQDVQTILGVISAGIYLALFALWVIYIILFSLLFPAIQVHFARTGTLGACFQIAEIFRLAFSNAGDYFTAWLVNILAGLFGGMLIGLVSGLGALIPCIGWIFSAAVSMLGSVWLGTIFCHLFGRVGARQPA